MQGFIHCLAKNRTFFLLLFTALLYAGESRAEYRVVPQLTSESKNVFTYEANISGSSYLANSFNKIDGSTTVRNEDFVIGNTLLEDSQGFWLFQPECAWTNILDVTLEYSVEIYDTADTPYGFFGEIRFLNYHSNQYDCPQSEDNHCFISEYFDGDMTFSDIDFPYVNYDDLQARLLVFARGLDEATVRSISVTYTVTVDDNYEPNNITGDAYELTEGTWLSSQDGIVFHADVDYYKFTITEPIAVTVDCSFVHSEENIDIELLDPSGSVIKSAQSTSDNERITHDLQAAGTYYIKVRTPSGYTGTRYDLRWSAAPITYTLQVYTEGQAAVAIAGEPSQYSGTSNYAQSVAAGSALTLTAPLYAGDATFLRWNGCDVADNTRCSLTMEGNRTVTASYTKPFYTLNIRSSAVSGVPISTSPASYAGNTDYTKTVLSGTTIQLDAPTMFGDAGFSGWSGCDSVENTTCTVQMSTNRTVTANYSQPQYLLQVHSSGAANIPFSTIPSMYSGVSTYSTTAVSGTTIIVSSPVSSGYAIFSEWSGCDFQYGNNCKVVMTENKTVTAQFTTPRHTLRVKSEGIPAVAITGNPATYSGVTDYEISAEAGSGITLSAPQNVESAVFDSWVGCDSSSGPDCTVLVEYDSEVTAVYVIPKYSLDIASSGTTGVAITGEPSKFSGTTDYSRTVDNGTSLTLSAPTTTENADFLDWTGCPTPSGNQCQLTVSGNTSITANYKQKFKLEVTSVGVDTVEISGNPASYSGTTQYTVLDIPADTTVLLTAPDELEDGASFQGWNDCDAVNGNTCTVAMSRNRYVEAYYRPLITLPLSVSAIKGYFGPSPIYDSVPITSNRPEYEGTTSYQVPNIPEGTTVILTAPENADGYFFDYWSGCDTTSERDCTITMNGIERATAHYVPGQFDLLVQSSGDSGVAVEGWPSTYSGTTPYTRSAIPVRTSITLTAPYRADDTVFVNWTGCQSVNGADCFLHIDSDIAVTANYEIPAYSLDITSSGAAGVPVNGSPSIYSGITDYRREGIAEYEHITLTAPESQGNAVFVDWSGCGSSNGTECTITMAHDTVLTAHYTTPKYSLNVKTSGTTGVPVTGLPTTYSGTSNYSVEDIPAATRIDISVPDHFENTDFAGWSGCDTTAGTICTVQMDSHKTVVANYSTPTVVLSVNAQGESSVPIDGLPAAYSGTTNYTKTVAAGTTVSLVAPETIGQSSFAGWSGCDSQTNTTCSVTMTEAKTITVNYIRPTYTLSVNSAGVADVPVVSDPANYSGSTSYAAPVPSGTTVLLTAPASKASATFTSWSGCDSTTGLTCELFITANTSVTANYTETTHQLTVQASGAANVPISSSPAGFSGTADYTKSVGPADSTIVLTAPMTVGYASFSGWSGCDAVSTTSCTVTLASDRTVTANYSTPTYSLGVRSDGAAIVPITGFPSNYGGATDYTRDNVPAGTQLELQAPQTHNDHSFTGWSGCTTSSATSCQVTMEDDMQVVANYSSPTVVQGILSGNVVWSGNVLITGDVLVDTGAVLTILPGTKVAFDAGSNSSPLLPVLWPEIDWGPEELATSWLLVKGTLIAEGTPEQMITFTSDSSSPAPGDWSCIVFTDITTDSSIRYAVIEYGSDAINTSGLGDADNVLTLRNNIFRYSEEAILVGETCNVDIQYNTFYANGEAVDYHSSMAPFCNDITVRNNIITNNGKGLNNDSGCSYVTAYNNVWGNTIDYDENDGPIAHTQDISSDPLFLNYPTDVHLQQSSTSTTASEHGGEIGAYGIDPDAPVGIHGILHGNVVWSGNVLITGDVLVDTGAVLTILPGTKVAFDAGSNSSPLLPILWPEIDWGPDELATSWLLVKGTLIAEGTPEQMITFTSDSSSPAAGDWSCIVFTDITTDSSIRYAVIEYGSDAINTSGLGDSDNVLTLRNNIFRYSEEAILVGETCNVDIQYNTFYANGEAVDYHSSMAPFCNDIAVRNNIITNNGKGLNNDSGCSYITAYNNVWNNTIDYDENDGPIAHTQDISSDPLFLDYPTDVHLQANSTSKTASDHGAEIGVYGTPPPTGTQVHGILTGNVVWSGLIRVIGDVLVDADAVLTIMPGTRVEFSATGNTTPLLPVLFPGETFAPEELNRPWLIVQGILKANGSDQNLITFTSDAQSPAPGDWHSILFTGSNGDSSISYALLEYGTHCINTSSTADTPHLLTVHNTIIRSSEGALLLGGESKADIQYNTLFDNTEGVSYSTRMANFCKPVTLQNNIIAYNGTGIDNDSGCTYLSSHNNLWGNSQNYDDVDGALTHSLDISSNPLFVGYPSDVHLQSGSPSLTASVRNSEIGAYGYHIDCNGTVHGSAVFDNCGQCVGGTTGASPCEQDCNGSWGGTAYLDNCFECVGGTTGRIACIQDCNLIWGGTAYEDNCQRCVGGTTGRQPCLQDCTGNWGGSAYLDNCLECVGGTTGRIACTQDCSGTWGGAAYFDNCGQCVGGTTGSAPCTADCNGVWGGSAYLDNCARCVGGNTGRIACTVDCNGTWGGSASLDPCGICVGGTTGRTACTQDCNGDWGGSAYLDNCQQCVGGSTGNTACVQDCNGDWGGTAYLDHCFTCVGGNTGNSACTQDCNGDWRGSAYIDNCDACVGGNTGQVACEQDCAGIWGGSAYLDNCQQCVGGTTGETACDALLSISGDDSFDLTDVVLGLQVVSGMLPSILVDLRADVNDDQTIGIAEVLYTMHRIASANEAAGTVTSAGQVWLDRNLGASRVGLSATDMDAFGHLYQWGRSTDGHEQRDSETTADLSSSDTPDHSDFITSSNDWRSPQNSNLWQGVNGINNPCPAGFRVPTITEWETEMATWQSSDSSGAYSSPLKLVMAGAKGNLAGSLDNIGIAGSYWSSTAPSGVAYALGFNQNSADIYPLQRARGFSVRCLQD